MLIFEAFSIQSVFMISTHDSPWTADEAHAFKTIDLEGAVIISKTQFTFKILDALVHLYRLLNTSGDHFCLGTTSGDIVP